MTGETFAVLADHSILGRLMRRYAAEGTDRALLACVRLMDAAATESEIN